MIEEAEDTQRARAAQERLDELMGALSWHGDPRMHDGFSSADLDAAREKTAQGIERLMRQ